jgi:hypothetical protein
MAVVTMTIAIPGTLDYAHADAGCTVTNGVTVIVDFKALGGGIQRGCAMNPSSGLDALQKAGFGTAGTNRWGNAFVCRIDGKPGNPPEACLDTPPGNAYWAYYSAKASDAGWKYVSVAATLTRPGPGSIEGWAFGARVQPGIAPGDAIPPPVTVPPPTQPPPTQAPVTNPPVTVTPSGGNPPATTRTPTGSNNGGGGTTGGLPGVTTADDRFVAPPATLADGSPAPTVALSPQQKAKAKAAAESKAAKTKSATAKARAAKNPGTETSETQSGDAIVERTALGAPVDSSADGGSPLAAVLTVLVIAALAGGSFFMIRKRRLQSS